MAASYGLAEGAGPRGRPVTRAPATAERAATPADERAKLLSFGSSCDAQPHDFRAAPVATPETQEFDPAWDGPWSGERAARTAGRRASAVRR